MTLMTMFVEPDTDVEEVVAAGYWMDYLEATNKWQIHCDRCGVPLATAHGDVAGHNGLIGFAAYHDKLNHDGTFVIGPNDLII